MSVRGASPTPQQNVPRPPRLKPLTIESVYWHLLKTVQCNRPDESTPVSSIAEPNCACSAFRRCFADGYSAVETCVRRNRAAGLAESDWCGTLLRCETDAATQRASFIRRRHSSWFAVY